MSDYSPSIVKTHYLAFKEFLDTQDNDIKRQRGAKEKLIKLTNQQFQELSTDVYDELIRRTYNARESECLQSQSEFQQKRNEARAKLAALSPTRYRDLSQDIYNEIQRRFPNIVAEVESENQSSDTFNNNMSRSFNSKPAQSPYVAAQEQQQQTPNQKINFAPLDDVMANLKKELAYKNENEDPNAQRNVNDAELAELKRNNNFLKQKLDSLTEKYQTEKNRLEKELESIQETLTNRVKINEEQATEYSKLYNNYTQLQNDIKTLRSQSEVNEKVTEELRQENDIQIERINQLTTKNDNLEQENKSLKEEIDKLKEESAKLKEELQKEKEKKPEVVAVPSPAKSETEKEVKSESPKKLQSPGVEQETQKPPVNDVPPEQEMPNSNDEVNNYPRSNVRDCINTERVSSYREAVNQLLDASKSENPADVLVAMKSIVITCKNITEESDAYERANEKTFTTEEQDKLIEIKENLSIALTHLMNVTKNHATRYPDVSPSFIESATSELSDTIVSLVRTLKDHQNRLLNQQPLSRSSNNEKVYNVQELKHFLEERTDLIVQGIQSLLQKIQQPNASNNEFSDAIAHITGIVDNVISASQNTFSSQEGIYLYENGAQILQDLEMGNNRLKEMGSSINSLNEQEIKTLKSSLASASYEIAVFVRDLLELLG